VDHVFGLDRFGAFVGDLAGLAVISVGLDVGLFVVLGWSLPVTVGIADVGPDAIIRDIVGAIGATAGYRDALARSVLGERDRTEPHQGDDGDHRAHESDVTDASGPHAVSEPVEDMFDLGRGEIFVRMTVA